MSRREAGPVGAIGFFGPGSTMWHVASEGVLTLGTTRAILMQIAHPKVAQGVADHSAYRREPLRRALRTFKTANDFIFGDRQTATRSAAQLYAIHKRVRGTVRDDVPILPCREYSATDQDLLLWVYATLVDTVVRTHDAFLGSMDAEGWARYYEDSKVLAALFGIRASALPESLEGLRAWMDGMVADGQVVVTPTARAIADALQTSAWYLRLSRPLQYTLAVSTLPPQLRAGYGLGEDRVAMAAYGAAARVLRPVLRRVPTVFRRSPHALAASWRYRRLAKARAKQDAVGGAYVNTRSYQRERHWSSKPRLS